MAGARLPSEAEWELAARENLLEQAENVAWQWTRSAHSAYPGYRAAGGALGEYNGKFMVGQMVLRGGAVPRRWGIRVRATATSTAEQRWMFSGLRLARDVGSVDAHTEAEDSFAADVVAGLSAWHKQLPPKYFYDTIGPPVQEDLPNRTTTTSPAPRPACLATSPGNLRPAFPQVQSWWSSAAETAPRHAGCSTPRRSFRLMCRSILARTR